MRQIGQPAGKPYSAHHVSLRPDELFHPVLWLDPGTTRFTPPRRRCDGKLKAFGIGRCYGMAKGVFPVWLHIDQAFGDDLRGV
jgi:hypothetical protein